MTAKLAVYGAYDDTPLHCPSQAMTSPKKALSGGLKALPTPHLISLANAGTDFSRSFKPLSEPAP